MKRYKLSCLALAAAAAVALAPQIASADMISFSDSIGSTATDWTDSVSLTQFNPALGTLNSVTIYLNGQVAGDAGYEHLGTQLVAPQITTKLQSEIKVYTPSLTTLVTVLPVASNTAFNVPTWDGTTDYAGTSGFTYTGLSASDSDSAVFSTNPILSLFSGIGSITLPVTAEGQSFASGNGNVATQFHNAAAADVTVVYDYTPAQGGPIVPVPAAAPAGMALLGLLGLRRWKKNSAAH